MNRFISVFVFSLIHLPHTVFAQAPINFNLSTISESMNFSSSMGLLLSVSAISLIPFFLMSTTSFLRFLIVLGMLRNAMQTNQSPPNMVIISLALFMTLYVMSPTWSKIYEDAIIPYQTGVITQDQALTSGFDMARNFMLKYTREKDLALFIEFSKISNLDDIKAVPIYVIIPAFLISELRTAFQIGFLLFIPFVVIDLVVSNILLSLGMFMLSPVMISLPFKILLFVLTDGWNVLVRGLLAGYQ